MTRTLTTNAPTTKRDKFYSPTTIEFEGDVWRIRNAGAERNGKMLAHLVSTTRTTKYRNEEVPLEMVEYVDTRKLGGTKARIYELFQEALGHQIYRVNIITSCTDRKSITSGKCPAQDLYAGEQHKRLMQSVGHAQGLETTIEILSAGYGLISGELEIEPYNETFSGLPAAALKARSDQLNIPADIRKALNRSADLTIVLLGDTYLRACQLPEVLETSHPVIFIHGKSSTQRIPRGENIHSAELCEEDTRLFGAGLIGLKGAVAGRLIEQLADPDTRVQKHLGPASNFGKG